MRVGVTGATGFLGSHLCRRLVAGGDQVVVLRRPSSDLRDLEGVAVESVAGEVTEAGPVGDLVHGCDAVFHAAATLVHDPARLAEHERVNVEGSRIVAETCRAQGVGRLVHVSSVAAIGVPEDGRPADEDFRFNVDGPPSSYHVSKKRGEDAVLAEVGRGLDATIVNPSLVVGPYRGSFRRVDVADVVRRHRLVPYFRGGNNFVHVADVVEGVIAALGRGATGQRYILGGENLTYRRMAQIAAEELEVRRLLVPVPGVVTALAGIVGDAVGARTGRRTRFTRERHRLVSLRLFYDSQRAQTELGYRSRPYREIVREFVTSTGATQ
jgi:dihydroflavonol-4-reductase